MAGFRVFAAVSLLAVVGVCRAGEPEGPSRLALGREVFEQGWLRPPADDSPLAIAPGGDGLGPVFNGASCAECHFLGGVGGAGPNENNVEILSLALPLDTPADAVRNAMRRAKRTHPEFHRNTNVFLHTFGRDETGSLKRYAEFRELLRSEFPAEVVSAAATERRLDDGLPYQLAQRNTPALFGAGLIESIKPELVRAVAERQRQTAPSVAGIPVDDGAGRYGWRGQIPTLEGFVRTACAEELGMQVADGRGGIRKQPGWPTIEGAPKTRIRERVDLSEVQVVALLDFVRGLPRPEQVLPEDPAARSAAEMGRVRFDAIGCSVCHVADMGPVEGIYSDMLLHDMGSTFADRVGAPIDIVPPQVFSQTRIRGRAETQRGYGGVSTTLALFPTTTTVVLPPSLGDLTKATQAFRTPALWGVADSAPYLHDGRAATLDEAIRLHGGQAEESAKRFIALSSAEQEQVVGFLETLRAPRREEAETQEEG